MTTPDQSDGWIAFIERKPQSGRVWLCDSDNYVALSPLLASAGVIWNERWTHWMPANVPAPPKREPTQDDQDEEAFMLFRAPMPDVVSLDEINVWRAALEWEREQVREMMDGACMAHAVDASRMADIWDKLARRVGLKQE